MKKWKIAKNKLLDPNWETPVKAKTKEIVKTHKEFPTEIILVYMPIIVTILMILYAIKAWLS